MTLSGRAIRLVHARHLSLNVIVMDGPRPAKLDEWDEVGMTPLILAVFRGAVSEVRKRLEQGADPNRPNSMGATPLWSAEDDFGLHEIAALLRSYGATAK